MRSRHRPRGSLIGRRACGGSSVGSQVGRRENIGRAFGIDIHGGVAGGPQGGGGGSGRCVRCRGGLWQVKSYGGGLWMQCRVKPAQAQLVNGKGICSKSAGVEPEQDSGADADSRHNVSCTSVLVRC